MEKLKILQETKKEKLFFKSSAPKLINRLINFALRAPFSSCLEYMLLSQLFSLSYYQLHCYTIVSIHLVALISDNQRDPEASQHPSANYRTREGEEEASYTNGKFGARCRRNTSLQHTLDRFSPVRSETRR